MLVNDYMLEENTFWVELHFKGRLEDLRVLMKEVYGDWSAESFHIVHINDIEAFEISYMGYLFSVSNLYSENSVIVRTEAPVYMSAMPVICSLFNTICSYEEFDNFRFYARYGLIGPTCQQVINMLKAELANEKYHKMFTKSDKNLDELVGISGGVREVLDVHRIPVDWDALAKAVEIESQQYMFQKIKLFDLSSCFDHHVLNTVTIYCGTDITMVEAIITYYMLFVKYYSRVKKSHLVHKDKYSDETEYFRGKLLNYGMIGRKYDTSRKLLCKKVSENS